MWKREFEMAREIIGIILILIGTAFILIAAIGLIRLPDLYLRMSASTKASTLGVGCVLLATAVYFNDFGVTLRVIAVILFLLLTAPVAAHKMGRAAYFNGVPLWSGTRYNELEGRYDPKTHTLASSDGQGSAGAGADGAELSTARKVT
jgi:multicomponent Na+:H+ antiporter subunit G